MQDHRSLQLWLFLAVVASSFVGFCSADCPDLGTFEDQFELAPLVARVRLTGQCVDVPCGSEVLQNGLYTYRKAMNSYEVIQVFKGDLSVGQDIPIIYSTDTGHRLRNPNDDEDFVAFMSSSLCDEIAGVPSYSVSDCFTGNKKWSYLPEAELSFLNVTNNDIPVETGLDAGCPFGCNCPRWRFFCRFFCWFRRLFS